ncbi:MAG: hypothetical protein ACLFSY_06435 [Desulfonatronovibrionaceae bacterium]
MAQATFDADCKCIRVPGFLFFSKKIPLSQVKGKSEEIRDEGSGRVYRLTLFGDFGEKKIDFFDYEGYASFIYEYEKARLSS